MRGKPLIFLGGCSGTGKTTLASALPNLCAGLRTISASSLLDLPPQRPPIESRAQAQHLQHRFLRSFLASQPTRGGPLAIDGHYVVPTSEGLFEVPLEIFRLIEATLLVLVEDDAEEIAARLQRRQNTSWWDGKVDTIQKLMQAEREHALEVSKRLDLELLIVNSAPCGASAILKRANLPLET